MAVWGGAATWETGNWKLGAHLKCISFVKNVEEAPGRFRSVDLVRYIKTGSSQCAAICVLEFRKSGKKNVSIFGTSRIHRLSRKADPGNPEIRKARRDHSNRGRRRHLQRRCARRRIAADAHDAPCNSRAAAVMRDVIPVTGTGADVLRRRTSPRWQGLDAAAARARCSTLVAIMRALNKLERPRRRRRWPEWDRNRTAISEFPVSEFPLSRFTMSMMRFHTKWSRFNQPGEIPVSSFHDQGASAKSIPAFSSPENVC